MNAARKALNGILWLAPIHRWTTAVTIAFVAGVLLWIVAITTGLTDIAKSPTAVAMDAYWAAQEREADELRGYLAEEARAAFDSLTAEEVEALLARLSNNHTTSELESIGVRNYGSHAVVGVSQDFTDDFTTLRVEVAVKEGRYWRLEWPLGEADWTEANQRFDPHYRPGAGTGT